jgi:hypothetical protein
VDRGPRRTRRGGLQPESRAVAAAGLAIVIASLALPASAVIDHSRVLSVGAGAGLVEPRTSDRWPGRAGDRPRAGTLRWLAIAVWPSSCSFQWSPFDPRPRLSLVVAATLTLVTLPITWYHYPTALLPFAAALAVADPGSRRWLALAAAIACVAIVWLPLTWAAVAVVLVAALDAARHAPRRSASDG